MLADIGPNETYVLVALIGGLPAIMSAVFAYLIHSKIKTPSGTSIGKQVEDAHVTAIVNTHKLDSIGAKVGAETPAPLTAAETPGG